MALSEITKITGPGIHTLSNVLSHNIKSSGIITATNTLKPAIVETGAEVEVEVEIELEAEEEEVKVEVEEEVDVEVAGEVEVEDEFEVEVEV